MNKYVNQEMEELSTPPICPVGQSAMMPSNMKNKTSKFPWLIWTASCVNTLVLTKSIQKL